jgi:hypothetical protein
VLQCNRTIKVSREAVYRLVCTYSISGGWGLQVLGRVAEVLYMSALGFIPQASVIPPFKCDTLERLSNAEIKIQLAIIVLVYLGKYGSTLNNCVSKCEADFDSYNTR